MLPPSGSQHWGDCLDRLLRGDDGGNFKFYKVLPLDDPLLEQPWVVAFHELKAAVEVRLDPAPHVLQAGGGHAPLLLEAAIHCPGIPVLEAFDHHEKHTYSFSTPPVAARCARASAAHRRAPP